MPYGLTTAPPIPWSSILNTKFVWFMNRWRFLKKHRWAKFRRSLPVYRFRNLQIHDKWPVRFDSHPVWRLYSRSLVSERHLRDRIRLSYTMACCQNHWWFPGSLEQHNSRTKNNFLSLRTNYYFLLTNFLNV